MASDVDVLRARERSKRLLVLGTIVAGYAAAWLFLGWRGARIESAQCTVGTVDRGVSCTVSHELDGERHELPHERCDRPTRWPRGAAVGTRLDCFYYPSRPDEIFFEPRTHRWPTPAPLVVLALGMGTAGLGLASGARRAAPREAPGSPYRAPFAPTRDPRPPLEIPLSVRHWSRSLIGAFFLVPGLVLVALGSWLAWEQTGEVELGELVFALFCHGVALAGAFSIFYRSGIVIDADRGLVSRWWGLVGPWFRAHRALDTLRGARAATTGHGRTIAHVLLLEFDDATWKHTRPIQDEAIAEAARIEGYLSALRRPPQG